MNDKHKQSGSVADAWNIEEVGCSVLIKLKNNDHKRYHDDPAAEPDESSEYAC